MSTTTTVIHLNKPYYYYSNTTTTTITIVAVVVVNILLLRRSTWWMFVLAARMLNVIEAFTTGGFAPQLFTISFENISIISLITWCVLGCICFCKTNGGYFALL